MNNMPAEKLFQIFMDLISKRESEEGLKSNLQKTTMMVLAVTLHNIPEGMAEGEHSNLGTIMFMLGFVLMMILDVALG